MSARFDILATPIAGLHVLQRKPLGDSRGYLERLFCMDELHALIPGKRIEQINRTLTSGRGTVRGLHFQHPPHAETKFVHCLRGEVFDVAVDLRRDSPTFLRWHAEVLSAENHRTFVIPEGFAHGFQALADDCELLYFHTAAYCREAEGGLHVQDPRLAIHWPLPVAGLSPRDAAHPLLVDGFQGIET
ncbi:MAG: dTDP-4-dehydrorhamnose 3,5-epimerase [Rhodocyclaceae bacterium]|nr:dTDP-4-dehydrorhamnose 3,5-epimerase family protein [Zoogloeaceae bacterium]MCG3168451.1 dTDP-4-dehydrorhamnose 3,5-epimerase [Bacteroidia bacterium]MCQ3924428.1 dTDP-4-dehydrorhamnose 3,5-epimerase [Rhodocyclaceae bacterium]HNQ56236.1 dTDP-4-dehydrorhamnose 3,5-epimerase family protein [Candidatus Desulfobacillus denitrificans]HNT61509.1 dTDP-4-dehydrorhamnose 3,5-epimerase family protein [Candidatus Desulfobacillus denitrificans]